LLQNTRFLLLFCTHRYLYCNSTRLCTLKCDPLKFGTSQNTVCISSTIR